MAAPVLLVSVRCHIHPRRPVPGCAECDTAAQVMITFHNNDRCIPSRCVWPHVHGGP
jgi:hypothetical protein